MRNNFTGLFVVEAVGADVLCPGYHRKKCRFERSLAERRKTGIDPVKPLDTFSVPAASSIPARDRGFVVGRARYLLATKIRDRD